MAWNTHTPYRQPPGWKATRERILTRDRGICYVCRGLGATEVDHVVPVSEGGTHDDSNLAAIHVRCHKAKTGQEAARAGARNPRPTRQRTDERHPGLI